ncbi:MAG: AgmX/PglI C-terminal domain-containing protein [Myxococcota bacterium]
MGTPVSVQVFSGGQPTGTHQFNSDTHRTVKIGRLNSAQLKLEDPKAAKIHAVIDFSGGNISLIDMGSSTGTLVNGSKIHKVVLNHGDQVIIGDTQLVIGVGNGAVAQAATGAAPTGPAPVAATPAQPVAAQGFAPAPGPAAAPGSGPGPAGFTPTSAAAQPAAPAPMSAQPQAAAPVAAQAAATPGGALPATAAAVAAAAPQAQPGGLPNFDGPQSAPVERITQARLRSAAVESRPHPSLPPEETVGPDSRALEMRVYWGQILLSIDHFTEPKAITIGEVKGTNFFISSEGLPVEAFPLVRFKDGEYILTFAAGMDGEVEIGGRLRPLKELRASSLAKKDDDLEGSYRIALPVDTRVLVHWGGATFALRFVAPPKPLPAEFFKNLDLQYLNMLMLSVFFHIATVTTFLVYPYDTDALREDLFQDRGRFVELMLTEPEDNKKKEDLLKKLKEKIEKPKPEEKVKPDLKVVQKQPTERVKKPTSQAQKQAQVNQQFSKLFSAGGGGGGSLLGGGGGGSLSGTMMNVIGTTGSGGKGAMAGLGIRGSVMTGGGIGTSRGVAGIGTSGRLGGGGLAYGTNVGKLGQRQERGMISLSTPVVMGSLPKDVIKKVINQNRNQIRFCYEVELQKNQQLAGKVQMKWVIGATGSVVKTSVTQDTMQSKRVGQCLRQKIMGWKFPAPAGGGIVEVNYPFVFKSN